MNTQPIDSNESDLDNFGAQYSESELFDECLKVAELVQAFYLSGNTSKSPYGLTVEELVTKSIAGESISD